MRGRHGRFPRLERRSDAGQTGQLPQDPSFFADSADGESPKTALRHIRLFRCGAAYGIRPQTGAGSGVGRLLRRGGKRAEERRIHTRSNRPHSQRGARAHTVAARDGGRAPSLDPQGAARRLLHPRGQLRTARNPSCRLPRRLRREGCAPARRIRGGGGAGG